MGLEPGPSPAQRPFAEGQGDAAIHARDGFA
jgi:hypothetical protein